MTSSDKNAVSVTASLGSKLGSWFQSGRNPNGQDVL